MGFLREVFIVVAGVAIGWNSGVGVEQPEPMVVVRWVAEEEGVRVASSDADVQPSEPPPAVLAAATFVAPSSYPITRGDLYAALARSDWPSYLWAEVSRIAWCESGYNLHAEGDEGLAIGLLQIRLDAHVDLARTHDFKALDDALAAAWLVYTRAGGFGPWSCW